MSTLPDLNTDAIAHVAYINVLDVTSDSITSFDPEKALNDGNISDAELYDNGFDAIYNSNYHCRVKSDGWMLVYRDRDHDTTWGERGLQDIFGHPPTSRTLPSFYDYLKNMAQELDIWTQELGDVWSVDKIGFYDYEYPGAKGLTHFANNVGDSEQWSTTITITESTQPIYGIAAGRADDRDAYDGAKATVAVGGARVAYSNDWNSHGSVDKTIIDITDHTTIQPGDSFGFETSVRDGESGLAEGSVVLEWEEA